MTKKALLCVLAIQCALLENAAGFTTTSSSKVIVSRPTTSSALFVSASAASTSGEGSPSPATTSKKKDWATLRKEGGPLTFNTPIGALNPFAIYYGLMSLFLGVPWFIALKLLQCMYFITGGRFDKNVSLWWVMRHQASAFAVLVDNTTPTFNPIHNV